MTVNEGLRLICADILVAVAEANPHGTLSADQRAHQGAATLRWSETREVREELAELADVEEEREELQEEREALRRVVRAARPWAGIKLDPATPAGFRKHHAEFVAVLSAFDSTGYADE